MVPPESCGVELAVDNPGGAPLELDAEVARIGELSQLAWLVPARAGQPPAIVPAVVVDVQSGGAPPGRAPVSVPSGQRAVVLVAADPPLALDGAVLRSLVGGVEPVVLRP